MKSKRFFAFLLLVLISLPLLFSTVITVQTLTQPAPSPYIISSPYTLKRQYYEVQRADKQGRILVDYICNDEGEFNGYLYPYSHFNAECSLPLSVDGFGHYKIGAVNYIFQIYENEFQVSSIEFFSNKHWRNLLEKNGTLYEQRIDSSWPFNRKAVICDLPSESCFYDPIAISGLGGCGILLLSANDPGVETDIVVYVPTKSGWRQAQFLLPDGSETEQVFGFVRRKEDSTASDGDKAIVGKMEVCMKNQDGHYEVCHVAYTNDILILTPDSDVKPANDFWVDWQY